MANDPEKIHIVIAGNIVMAAYRERYADSAELHKRCVTGASVVSCELLDAVPREVLDDINVEWDADEDDDTPVIETHIEVPLGEIDDAKRR